MNDHRHVSPNEDGRWSCNQVRDELEAWSLGALDAAEMTTVDRHLSTCAACRQEADTLAGVASLLPLALDPVRPSPDVRKRLISRIAEDQAAASGSIDRQRVFPAVPAGATADPSTGSERSFHWSQMLIAPLAIALLVMSLWAFELHGQINDQDNGEPNVAAAMLPDGFQTFSMQSDCETCISTGKLLADPAKADALMVAWGLDPGEIHEVWCEERDGERVLVASLDVSETGEVVQPLVFDQPIAGYSKIYVTNADGDTVEIRLDAHDTTPGQPATSTT